MPDPKDKSKAAAKSKGYHPIVNPKLSPSEENIVSSGTINEEGWRTLGKINSTATNSTGGNTWNAKKKELEGQQRKRDSAFIVNNRYSSFNRQSSQLRSQPTPTKTSPVKTSFLTKFKRKKDGNLTSSYPNE